MAVGRVRDPVLPTNGNGAGTGRIEGVLEVMPSGPLPPDPAEFLTTRELAAIIEQLRDRCDVVIIDSPPALPVGDAMALSSVVDATLIVARAGVIRRGSLSELKRLLDTSPAAKLGFVLTGAEMGEHPTYGGGYGYYGDAAEPESRPAGESTPKAARS